MKIIITALAALLLFMGCNKSSKEANADMQSSGKEIVDEKNIAVAHHGIGVADTAVVPPTPGQLEKKKQPGQSQAVPNVDWDKKIIKNATLNIEVKDYNKYYTSSREKVKSLGGYVAQEEQSQSDYKIENTLVIKVPADQFDNAVVLLSANAEKVNERKISSQDVTTEFIDTKSRIEAKKQVRQRYMDLMNQAKNMEEILNVQSEINSIQEEIEAATGRITYLGHSSTFSTITLTYYQVLNSSAVESKDPTFGSRIGAAFKIGWGWITDLFVGLVSIWPLLLLIFISVIIYKRTKTSKPKPAM